MKDLKDKKQSGHYKNQEAAFFFFVHIYGVVYHEFIRRFRY